MISDMRTDPRQCVSVIIPGHWDLAVAVEQRLLQALYKRSASARRDRRSAHTHSNGRGALDISH